MTRMASFVAHVGNSARVLRLSLLSAALFDELTFGIPTVTLPQVQTGLNLTYTQAGLIFTVGEISALLIEPGMNLLADRFSKRWFVLGGMLALAAGYWLAASAPDFLWLALAFALIYPASGAAVSLAEGALMDASPNTMQRTMVWWTIMASIGDLLAPAVVTMGFWLGYDWRELFRFGALLWLAGALFVAVQRFPPAIELEETEEKPTGLRTSLHQALHAPEMLRWIGIVMVSAMLDEIFLGFAGLFLEAVRNVDAAGISLALGAFTLGSLLGLVLVERVLMRFNTVRVLTVMSLISLAGIISFLFVPIFALELVALMVLSVGASGWYPLAKAEAYTKVPGRTGTVRAIDIVIGAPFQLALPFVVGQVSDHLGIGVGVALLGLAPIAVLLLLPRTRATVLQ